MQQRRRQRQWQQQQQQQQQDVHLNGRLRTPPSSNLQGFPFQPVEELGAVPKRRAEDCRCAGTASAAGDDNLLFRGSSLLLRTLGVAYPVLVGLQFCITVAACAFLARLRRRQCAM